MKKIILLTIAIVIVMISNVALACGGVTFLGNSGKSYCLSKFTMNWYSAYAWCKDQGMNLIELDTTCGASSGSCSELALSSAEQSNITAAGGKIGTVWTNTSHTSPTAFVVNLSSGKVINFGRDNLTYGYAVCF